MQNKKLKVQNAKFKNSDQVTLTMVANDDEVKSYIVQANEQLGVVGYTEHGYRHAALSAKNARRIIVALKSSKRLAELAGIAGYLHDIGNVVSRFDHAQIGAVIARDILNRLGMKPSEVAAVIGAIGNHHEEDGDPVSAISAASILADKADVHRSRVRNPNLVKFDIHDRVNYAVTDSKLTINRKRKKIILGLRIDTGISPVLEYFEIFLSRMLISRRAADFLGCKFELLVNGTKLI
jgi:metal-dependent HD superfamily phosphatase/phosphodiesterase